MRIVTTDDGSRTLYSDRYQQTYHSTYGALTESQTIFVQGSQLHQRLGTARAAGRHLQVLEIGFGLGLNFLLSADLALVSGCSLAYTAAENDPVSVDVLKQLDYQTLLTFPSLCESLHPYLENYMQSTEPDAASTGRTSYAQEPAVIFRYREDEAIVHLALHQTLSCVFESANTHFDIIYLDAFSPDVNAECWENPILQQLFEATVPGGVLVTYSAKGSIRRGLQQAGFIATRLPGPPGKREFLKAEKPSGESG